MKRECDIRSRFFVFSATTTCARLLPMTARKALQEEHALAALNPLEQQLLLPKLLGGNQHEGFTAEEYQQAAARFETLIHGENQSFTPADKFLTLHNFLRQLCAVPSAWQQVQLIRGVARGYLELTVYDHHEFLRTLKAHGFAVNSWMETVSRWAGHGHRFDSARARTEHRHDPQLHLVNDRADEAEYGPNYFFVHWDAQSVYAERGWLLGRIAAGRTHASASATPQAVQSYLARLL